MSSPVQPVIVILAAGLGTRMKSARAKVLHSAGGKTLVEHVVDTALQIALPERVFVVIGHQAEAVRELLRSRDVGFIHQEKQKGTGHALMCGRPQLDSLAGPLLILYGDCPLISAETLRRLVEGQMAGGGGGTVLSTVLDDPTGYGRILRGEGDRVAAIVEQKAGSPEQLAVREINSGIYCFRSEAFWREIDHVVPNNAAREYYLTDVVALLDRAGDPVFAVKVDDSSEVLGINNRVELAAVDRLLRDRKTRDLMLAGVTIEKPETVTIDSAVTVGPDTVIEAFVHLRGKTLVGENCRIGACSIIENSQLASGVEVLPFTSMTGAKIESSARIGPFTRIRPGTHIGPRAHVGNFVELKNTYLGEGSKANHLAYLGDSDIGEAVNVGAGAITCNYDGSRKHKTIIGPGVFVGSNATIVAPVEIGAGAYVGAGSVVTHPVPKDALVVGRARQVVKEGWARTRRDAKLPPKSR
ncbi:MAG: bifunctional UDP-N-acetylglucosamine diphosphorylase/glucosamine-1-phosphate N-acetyltransferase GlmU [Bryobacteraceae bacterium]